MESQGEREPGVLEMDVGLVESMVQDGNPEQDIPRNMLQQSPPQTNPEPETGAAAAAAYDTSPPPLRQNPQIPAETDHPRAPDMAQLFAMLAEMNNKMDGNTKEMDNKMKANLKENTKEIKEEMKETRGEMQQMGRCLQAGIMATPRAGTNELGGSATVVRPAVGRVKTK